MHTGYLPNGEGGLLEEKTQSKIDLLIGNVVVFLS